jgi:hypothetical protein
MVVAEHKHQRKMFRALQMHLQEALGNPFTLRHVSLLSQNPQPTMCFTSVLSFVHTNYNFYTGETQQQTKTHNNFLAKFPPPPMRQHFT